MYHLNLILSINNSPLLRIHISLKHIQHQFAHAYIFFNKILYLNWNLFLCLSNQMRMSPRKFYAYLKFHRTSTIPPNLPTILKRKEKKKQWKVCNEFSARYLFNINCIWSKSFYSFSILALCFVCSRIRT